MEKLINKWINRKSNRALALSGSPGFTLLEIIIFVSIFSTLLLILSQVFASILDAQLESKSYSSIDLDGRFILARLAHDFQSADSANILNNSISTPATGAAGAILKIKINAILYTYSASTSGRFQLVTPVVNNLNSSESSISGLLFQRLGSGSNKDTIKVNFRLTSRTKRHRAAEYKDFQSAFAIP